MALVALAENASREILIAQSSAREAHRGFFKWLHLGRRSAWQDTFGQIWRRIPSAAFAAHERASHVLETDIAGWRIRHDVRAAAATQNLICGSSPFSHRLPQLRIMASVRRSAAFGFFFLVRLDIRPPERGVWGVL